MLVPLNKPDCAIHHTKTKDRATLAGSDNLFAILETFPDLNIDQGSLSEIVGEYCRFDNLANRRAEQIGSRTIRRILITCRECQAEFECFVSHFEILSIAEMIVNPPPGHLAIGNQSKENPLRVCAFLLSAMDLTELIVGRILAE